MKKLLLIILIGFASLAIIGCSADSASQELSDPTADGYPATVDEGYPVTSNEGRELGYPPLEHNSSYPQGPEFNIETPVTGGDTTVTGTGPEGVPIILVNVSEVGRLLGETTINQDGTFLFSLDEPLVSNHMIGIQLGDLSGTNFDENEFIYSDTYFVRPLVGILFDMVPVK